MMKSFCFAAFALLPAASSIWAAEIPYSNNFSGSGSNTAFAVESLDNDWTVTGGAYQFNFTSTAIAPSTASLPLTNVAGQSFVMQTNFNVSSVGNVNSNGATLGLAAFGASATFSGTNAASAYYLADWQVANSTTPGNLRILALGDTSGFTNTAVSVDANLGTPTQAVTPGTTYTLKLVGTYSGSTLSMTLGVFDALGNQIGSSATATDTSPLTGTNFGYRNRIGIGGGAFTANFDNFSVAAVAAVPEPTTLGLVAAGSLAMLARRRGARA